MAELNHNPFIPITIINIINQASSAPNEQYTVFAHDLASRVTAIMVNMQPNPREYATIELCYIQSLYNNDITNVIQVALETFRKYIHVSNYIRMADIFATFLRYSLTGENALFSMHYDQVYTVCRDEIISILHRDMHHHGEEEVVPLIDVKCVMEQSCIDIHHPKSVHNGGECTEGTFGEGCVVCLEQIVSGDEKRILTTCGHVFHAECIDTWLTCESNKCPLCRVSAGLSHPDHQVDN